MSRPADYLVGGWQTLGTGAGAIGDSVFTLLFHDRGRFRRRPPECCLRGVLVSRQPHYRSILQPCGLFRTRQLHVRQRQLRYALGTGQYSWDIGLSKTIPILERLKLDLRMDAFSVFNHPTFGNPATDITNTATVGRITSAGGNRTIQFSGKLYF